jgi:hypothetical protein
MTMVPSGGADCASAERNRKNREVISMEIAARDRRISLLSIFDILRAPFV